MCAYIYIYIYTSYTYYYITLYIEGGGLPGVGLLRDSCGGHLASGETFGGKRFLSFYAIGFVLAFPGFLFSDPRV